MSDGGGERRRFHRLWHFIDTPLLHRKARVPRARKGRHACGCRRSRQLPEAASFGETEERGPTMRKTSSREATRGAKRFNINLGLREEINDIVTQLFGGMTCWRKARETDSLEDY